MSEVGCRGFRGDYVLVPADGAAGGVVVVWRLRCVGAMRREVGGAGSCERASEGEGLSLVAMFFMVPRVLLWVLVGAGEGFLHSVGYLGCISVIVCISLSTCGFSALCAALSHSLVGVNWWI